MRGSAAFRAAVAPGGALAGPWVKNELWRRARAVPSLDLRFADNKSLVDATTGAQLVTFTRASSGTFVDSQGTIRTAVTNLMVRSEEFNDASWAKLNVTVTANSITAPNGTLTADTITDSSDGSATTHLLTTTTLSFVSGLAYNLSIYAKAGTLDGTAILFPSSAFTSNLSARFNLQTGVVAASDSGVSAQIVSVGDGWYRCSAVATATAAASSTIQVRTATATTSFYQGNGTGTIFLWGAQLEQSSTVGEYVPTTSTINSAPRFDHNPTTGESLGLLVEEQRTNLLLRSEEFDGATWTKVRASVTANAIVAPNGTLTADKLVENTDNNTHVIEQAVTLPENVNVVYGFYVKKAERSIVRIQFLNKANTACRAYFNVDTAVVSDQSNATGSIVNVGDGWYRCSISFNSGSGATATTGLIGPATVAGTPSYAGDGTSGIYLWGAQLEAGAFPTSYIPTTTATVTRSADVASITGSAFSSWYRQDEGTVFAELVPRTFANLTGVASADDNSSNNRVAVRTTTSSLANLRVGASGVAQADFTASPTLIAGVLTKIAGGYKTDDFAISANGSTAASDTSGTSPTLANQLTIGTAVGNSAVNAPIRRITYWPRRLGNEVLQGITQ